MLRHAALSLAALFVLPLMAGEGFRWKVDAADERLRPDMPEAYSMGGIAWVSNDVYWTVTDEKHRPVVWELELPVESVAGKLCGCQMKMLCRPEKAVDVEAIARDPLDGSIWLADERKGEIRQYDPITGKRLAGQVALPKSMGNARRDFGLESLAISRDGLTMWTCSEEALELDGPLSTRKCGTDVRLTCLKRESVSNEWTAAGQWVYRTDPIVGKKYCDSKGEEMTRSGISELCILDDGTLLVLEREFSVVLVPRIRCRIYETDFSMATEVLGRATLQGEPVPVAVGKKLLHESTGFAMYEGLCVGQELSGGARVLMLVSDGDDKTFRSVMSLRLTPRSTMK